MTKFKLIFMLFLMLAFSVIAKAEDSETTFEGIQGESFGIGVKVGTETTEKYIPSKEEYDEATSEMEQHLEKEEWGQNRQDSPTKKTEKVQIKKITTPTYEKKVRILKSRTTESSDEEALRRHDSKRTQ